MTAQPIEQAPPATTTTGEYPSPLPRELARAQELLAEVESATDHDPLAVNHRCGELTAQLRLLISAVKGDAALRALRDAR